MSILFRPRSRHCSAAFVVCACFEALSGPVNAGEPIHPALAEAIDTARLAHGVERYAALRGIWNTWDQSDPTQVEEALIQFAQDPAADEPSKAYGSLLAAYARLRRGDVQGAQNRISALGYIGRWLVVGPFDNEGRSGLDRAFELESQLGQPLDLQRVYEGKERAVRWRLIPDAYPFAQVDLSDLLRPKEKVCAYATTFVRSNKQAPATRAATVWVGVTGACKLFWNGEQVLADSAYRILDFDRLAAEVTLLPGWNQLTIKVCADDHSPRMAVRMADAKGAPDSGIEVAANPTLAREVAKNLKPPRKAQKSPTKVALRAEGKMGVVEQAAVPAIRNPPTNAVRGPLQEFERLTTQPSATPTILEAYARYLASTRGDDPTLHRARMLADRAADMAPSINRELLSASLSEDRNLERGWVDKAVSLSNNPNNIKILLAQARLARRGVNWRDAVPFFDRVLQLDQDNTEAILGRVDLYNEAGLRRMALNTLEQAIERNPRSVALLGPYAAQLSSLERQAEADQIADRYSAYRFDDPTQQTWRIRLAVARRDKALAEHWISRLLATDPGSGNGLGIAARSYYALGMPDRALEMYQRALELAPEDTDMMKQMAELLGEQGRRAEQVQLLRKILVLRPQSRDTREYLEHIEPPRPRTDEAYAWEPEKFLRLRSAPSEGYNQRTLRKLQVTTVYESGLSSRFHQEVYQPLTDEAAAAARQYSFVYQADRQAVQLRAGRVFRADGRVDEATESSEGPADNPEIAMYTSARVFYVQFPRVNVGDIVEVRYRIDDVTAQNVYADYFGEVIFLQSTSPVSNAEYIVAAPKSRPLNFHTSALPGLVQEQRESADERLWRFFLPQAAAILPEPHMPPWPEVLGNVHVSTYRTWDDVGRWYWGLIKDQLVPDNEVRASVDSLTKGMTTERQKVQAIYNYVVQRTRYVALEFGIYGFKPRPASQTFSRSWGDCKDKAALLVSMMRVAGIPASMVLVRTGMRGHFASEPASLAPFDHAVAYVPSLDLYLDGTAQFTGPDELPAMDRGALGLMVNEQGSRLVHLPDPPADQTRRTRLLEATVAPNGSAQVDMKLEASGAFAANWRDRYHGAATLRERVAHDVAGDLPGFELNQGTAGIEAGNLDDINQPPRLRLRGRAPTFGRKDGDAIALPVAPHDRFVSSLASLSQRHHDLRLHFASTLDETWILKIPAGMSIRSMPTPSQRADALGSYELTVEKKDQTVTVHTKVAFEHTRIRPEEYPAFLRFCEEVDRVFSQSLVVTKAK